MVWQLYVLRTRSGMLYTGISTDVARRLAEHAGSPRGARALRARGPLTLVYTVSVGSRSEALRLEHAFKRLARATKERMLAAQPTLAALRKALGRMPADAPPP